MCIDAQKCLFVGYQIHKWVATKQLGNAKMVVTVYDMRIRIKSYWLHIK